MTQKMSNSTKSTHELGDQLKKKFKRGKYEEFFIKHCYDFTNSSGAGVGNLQTCWLASILNLFDFEIDWTNYMGMDNRVHTSDCMGCHGGNSGICKSID